VRGEFSTTEAALKNFFDLLQYASTIIFWQPDLFKYPTLISCISVGIAFVIYAVFVRKRRGHLVHFYEKLVERRQMRVRE
jgi:solute carrier family 40 (iron-regulated transporter), member 1